LDAWTGPTNHRNWILFNIASYVGCSAEKSDSGAMKIMKISDSSA
jgi:hypothetical protein